MAEYDKVIPPGQEGHIKLVIDGKKVSGRFSKTATVISNDPTHPNIIITLAGNEMQHVDVLPKGRVFLQGQYGDPAFKSLRVLSKEQGEEFKVTGVSSNVDDKITYRLEEGATKGEYVVKVFKNPKLPTMNTFGTLYVHSNNEGSPETPVQLQITTKGSITVQPSTVNFGRVRFGSEEAAGAVMTKSFTVVKPRGEFAIRDIRVDNDHFEWDVQELVPGRRYKVNVVFKPPMKEKPKHNEFAEMTIQTDDPREPQLSVRLIARAR